MVTKSSKKLFAWISIWGLCALTLAAGALFPPLWNLESYKLDKLLHLSGAACLSFIPTRFIKPRLLRYGMIASALVASAGVEFLQPLFPPHMFSWTDIATNSAGIALGYILGRHKNKKTRPLL